jgi:hypothetical protein
MEAHHWLYQENGANLSRWPPQCGLGIGKGGYGRKHDKRKDDAKENMTQINK